MRKTFKFDLDDKVNITECELEGRVVSISISRLGTEYKVKYYVNKEIKYEWFFEDELEAFKDQTTVGFIREML